MKIPENYQAVMPYLIIEKASDFSAFTQKVFGAKETYKSMRDETTIMHAEIMIGGCTIMFAEATEKFKVSNAGLFIYVDDADQTYKSALENGASVVTELENQPYGRGGGVKDPFGNVWWITSVI
ncbi:MAG: VOC family protein [Ginsengibacter sp.]